MLHHKPKTTFQLLDTGRPPIRRLQSPQLCGCYTRPCLGAAHVMRADGSMAYIPYLSATRHNVRLAHAERC